MNSVLDDEWRLKSSSEPLTQRLDTPHHRRRRHVNLLAALHKAVLDACDAHDGVKDGVLEDPRRCDFDPRTLACSGGDDADCLTDAQVRTVHAFYAPLVNPRTHTQMFPGLERGGELLWGDQALNGAMVDQSNYGRGAWLGAAVFQDPNWNYKTFDVDSGLTRADQLDEGLMTLSPNLQAFLRAAGNSCTTTVGATPGFRHKAASTITTAW